MFHRRKEEQSLTRKRKLTTKGDCEKITKVFLLSRVTSLLIFLRGSSGLYFVIYKTSNYASSIFLIETYVDDLERGRRSAHETRTQDYTPPLSSYIICERKNETSTDLFFALSLSLSLFFFLSEYGIFFLYLLPIAKLSMSSSR